MEQRRIAYERAIDKVAAQIQEEQDKIAALAQERETYEMEIQRLEE